MCVYKVCDVGVYASLVCVVFANNSLCEAYECVYIYIYNVYMTDDDDVIWGFVNCVDVSI